MHTEGRALRSLNEVPLLGREKGRSQSRYLAIVLERSIGRQARIRGARTPRGFPPLVAYREPSVPRQPRQRALQPPVPSKPLSGDFSSPSDAAQMASALAVEPSELAKVS